MHHTMNIGLFQNAKSSISTFPYPVRKTMFICFSSHFREEFSIAMCNSSLFLESFNHQVESSIAK